MNEYQTLQACDPYQLIEALMRGSKNLESRLDAALRPVGVSATKWYALRHLAEAGNQLSLGQLADRLSCVKSNATQLVDRLESENLVQRLPDPQDRRIILAELTPAGHQAYLTGLAKVQDVERELLGDFQDDERMVLHKLLSRLGSLPLIAI